MMEENHRQMVVLGIDHGLHGAEKCPAKKQIADPTYGVLIKKLIADFELDYIFEEAAECGPTIARNVADLGGVGYCDVDLALPNRILSGVESDFDFEDYVIYEINDPRMPNPEPFATLKKVETQFGRERLWVARISETSFTKGLMICGYAHLFSVAARLDSLGVKVEKALYYMPKVILATAWLKEAAK
jgi:hypothetical protein